MKPVSSQKLFGYIVLVAIIFFAACRKKDNNLKTTSCPLSGNYKIMHTGGYYGDTIQLSSDLPACAKRLWVYRTGGDVYSNDFNPKHVFAYPGEHFVIIIVDGDSANLNGFNPSIYIRVALPYDATKINAMKGTRYWDVYEDSVKYMPDEKVALKQYKDTFAVDVINDSTINFKGETLKGFSLDKATGVIDAYTFVLPSASQLEWATLKYYFNSDSLVCTVHPFQGGLPMSGKRPAQPYGITTTYHSHK